MKRSCTSFSTRPGFPRGLQVLVLDAIGIEAASHEAMLIECGFSPTICRSSAEANQRLTNPAAQRIDIMLCDAACLAKKTPENAALLAWAKTLPLVLMASSSMCPAEIISGITKQGAVDFMEKPLNVLKVKNIWQHVVRRQLAEGDVPSGSAKGKEEHSRGSGHEDTCSGDASGSNVSSQAKEEAMELDLETSSLLDAAYFPSLSGFGQGFSSLLAGEQQPASSGATSGSLGHSGGSSLSCMTAAPFATLNLSKGRSSVELRRSQHPLMQHGRPAAVPAQARPTSAPPINAAAASVGKMVMGHSCGQLPMLPAPGMTWGLPTTPLHISPKPCGTMPPWMPPGMMMMPPPPGMMGMPPPGMMMQPPTSAVTHPLHQGAAGGFRRAESSPLTAVPQPLPSSLVHSLSFVMSFGGSADLSAGAPLSDRLAMLDLDPSDIPQTPPIGLRLHKSASLLDMINSGLVQCGGGRA